MIYGGKVTWLFDPRFRYVVVDRFYFNSAWDIPHYVTINLYHQKFGNQIYHETLAISLPNSIIGFLDSRGNVYISPPRFLGKDYCFHQFRLSIHPEDSGLTVDYLFQKFCHKLRLNI